MTIYEAILLGIVQGLTEFLPISSSGHLAVFQYFLGFEEPAILLDICLHVGTLCAVIFYLWPDLKIITEDILTFFRGYSLKKASGINSGNFLLSIVVASVPTAIIGLILKSPAEAVFVSVTWIGIMLVITGCIVGLSFFIPTYPYRGFSVELRFAFIIGIAQGLAVIPGISRSGITIICALLCGIHRELAGKFSFFISIPAIIGALLLSFKVESLENIGLIPLFVGFFTAAIIGWLALVALMRLLKKGKLYIFAPYCCLMGLIAIVAG